MRSSDCWAATDHVRWSSTTPGLSSIPLVGSLFKSQRRVTRKSELVILLKPVVVEDERTWSVAAQQSLDRIRSLQ